MWPFVVGVTSQKTTSLIGGSNVSPPPHKQSPIVHCSMGPRMCQHLNYYNMLKTAWLSSTSLLPIQLQLLSVDSFCSVAISSSTEGECNGGGSGNIAVTGIVAGILTVVVLVIIVTLIVILALVYRHRYSTINIKERE